MNDSLAPQTADVSAQQPGEKPASFLQNLVDVYFAPKDAFTRIARRPSWIAPAIAAVVLSIAFFAIWSSKMEPREFMKAQLEQSARVQEMPAEQREQILDQQLKFFLPMGWIGSIVGTIVALVFTAGVLFFVFRFFYGGELRFAQSLAICSWVFFAVSLVTSPLTLTVMSLKSDWNLNPAEVLQANPTLLLDRTATAKPLWAFASGIDLFSIWMVFLLAVGYGVATRKSTGTAFWGVLLPWLALVLVKTGWAALF